MGAHIFPKKNPVMCATCCNRSNFTPRQRICYGEDLNADIYSETRIAMENFSVNGTFMPGIQNVLFNNAATIVFWSDGTKTVVKAVNEKFDPEKGLAMAIAKKALGNKGNYFNRIKKWTAEYSEKTD